MIKATECNQSSLSMIRRDLWNMRDEKYRLFSAKLTPTVDPDTIIGVRIPKLRLYAKRLSREGSTEEFLRKLPHEYLEENNLHAFILEQMRDFDACIAEIDRFLPFIDNWATCDSLRPKCFAASKDRLLPKIREWIASSHEYSVRFGIECLMLYYLDEDFDECAHELVAAVRRDEYYVKMMIAWYFATALAKQWDKTIPYISPVYLDSWVLCKTLQKAYESYRITDEQKQYLRSLNTKERK